MKSRLRNKILKQYSQRYGWSVEQLKEECPACRTDNRNTLQRRLRNFVQQEMDYYISRMY